jgi:hypothetical protein
VVWRRVPIPVHKQAPQRSGYQVGHEGAVVPAHSLQALAIHAVVGIRPGGKEQAGIALLADEQVGEVDLRGPHGGDP